MASGYCIRGRGFIDTSSVLYCGVVVLWWRISYLTEIKTEAVILFYQLSHVKITQWPITVKRRLLTPNVNPVANGNS